MNKVSIHLRWECIPSDPTYYRCKFCLLITDLPDDTLCALTHCRALWVKEQRHLRSIYKEQNKLLKALGRSLVEFNHSYHIMHCTKKDCWQCVWYRYYDYQL